MNIDESAEPFLAAFGVVTRPPQFFVDFGTPLAKSLKPLLP